MRHRTLALAATLIVTCAMIVASAVPASADAPIANRYHSPTAIGATTYFAGYQRTKNVELFATDGTAEGTRFVKDVFPGAASAFTDYAWDYGFNLEPEFTALGNKTVFRASGPTGVQLWVTDGTAAGTIQLTNETIYRNNQLGANPDYLVAYKGKVYFNADSATDGFELWVTDGTVAGTKVAADIIPPNLEPKKLGKTVVSGSYPYGFAVAGDILYFLARQRTGNTWGWGLYQNDGTTTKLDVVLPAAATNDFELAGLTTFGDEVVWPVDPPAGGINRDLWISDGSTAGTRLYSSGVSLNYTAHPVEFDGQLYYVGSLGALSRSNGEGARAVPIASDLYGEASNVVVQGGKLWYLGYDRVSHTPSLWTVSSAGAAPEQLKGLDPTRLLAVDFDSAWLNNALYFVEDGSIWKSDGTAVGTTKVMSLGLAGNRIDSLEMTSSATSITITLRDAHETDQLWLSDGTAAGTERILPLSSFTAPAPTIKGTPTVGTELGGRVGTWSPTDTAFTYQWKANGTAIAGATGKYFTVTAAQVGTKLTFSVTGTRSGYAQTTRTSAASALVTSPWASTGTATVTGTAKVGSTLAANPGAWSPTPKLAYQWYANGVPIRTSGTSSTYRLIGALVGKVMTVKVTATKSGYPTTSSISTAAAKVAK
jgi:ELWxxDGT repeat protein